MDPTDGTAVYSTDWIYYSDSIALADRETKSVLFGSVYQPTTGRQFLRKNNTLIVKEIISRNGKNQSVTRSPMASQSKGFPEFMGCAFGTSKYYDKVPGIKDKLKKIFDKTLIPTLEREYGMIDSRPASGSSALFCCDIADGKRHFALLYFQKAWDLAVGVLYARDAGCIVTCGNSLENIEGGNLEKTIARCTKDTLVNVGVFANPYVQREVMQRFNS
ncbi:MAG: hypothetical protein NTZ83_04635 [Candidatus Pacearchaeota archaeon]|nr:hypothetical protein [Candidatus Pacearchaeota archaeon]